MTKKSPDSGSDGRRRASSQDEHLGTISNDGSIMVVTESGLALRPRSRFNAPKTPPSSLPRRRGRHRQRAGPLDVKAYIALVVTGVWAVLVVVLILSALLLDDGTYGLAAAGVLVVRAMGYVLRHHFPHKKPPRRRGKK